MVGKLVQCTLENGGCGEIGVVVDEMVNDKVR